MLLVASFLNANESLGDYFYSREQYFEAITEYKRALFCRNYSSEDGTLYKMALAFYAGNQNLAAEEVILRAIINDESSPTDFNCLILLAKIHWDNYDYTAMRNVLEKISENVGQQGKEQILYIKAWTYFYQADWDTGIQILDSIAFLDTKALATDIIRTKSVPQKSRILAVAMSNIIPGSGHLYAQDPKNALYSFLLVGSTMLSIADNILKEAYLVSMFKFLFIYTRYSNGTLKNLAKKVERDNVNRIGDYLKTISEKYPKPLDILDQLSK